MWDPNVYGNLYLDDFYGSMNSAHGIYRQNVDARIGKNAQSECTLNITFGSPYLSMPLRFEHQID